MAYDPALIHLSFPDDTTVVGAKGLIPGTDADGNVGLYDFAGGNFAATGGIMRSLRVGQLWSALLVAGNPATTLPNTKLNQRVRVLMQANPTGDNDGVAVALRAQPWAVGESHLNCALAYFRHTAVELVGGDGLCWYYGLGGWNSTHAAGSDEGYAPFSHTKAAWYDGAKRYVLEGEITGSQPTTYAVRIYEVPQSVLDGQADLSQIDMTGPGITKRGEDSRVIDNATNALVQSVGMAGLFATIGGDPTNRSIDIVAERISVEDSDDVAPVVPGLPTLAQPESGTQIKVASGASGGVEPLTHAWHHALDQVTFPPDNTTLIGGNTAQVTETVESGSRSGRLDVFKEVITDSRTGTPQTGTSHFLLTEWPRPERGAVPALRTGYEKILHVRVGDSITGGGNNADPTNGQGANALYDPVNAYQIENDYLLAHGVTAVRTMVFGMYGGIAGDNFRAGSVQAMQAGISWVYANGSENALQAITRLVAMEKAKPAYADHKVIIEVMLGANDTQHGAEPNRIALAAQAFGDMKQAFTVEHDWDLVFHTPTWIREDGALSGDAEIKYNTLLGVRKAALDLADGNRVFRGDESALYVSYCSLKAGATGVVYFAPEDGVHPTNAGRADFIGRQAAALRYGVLAAGTTTEPEGETNPIMRLFFRMDGGVYATQHATITPDDDHDIPTGPCVVYVGSAGDVQCMDDRGEVQTYKNVSAGTRLPIITRRVLDAETSAGFLLALY